MDGVDVSAVQVGPGADGAVGDAHVRIAVLPHRHSCVGLRPVAPHPADRAYTVLAEHVGVHILRHARG